MTDTADTSDTTDTTDTTDTSDSNSSTDNPPSMPEPVLIETALIERITNGYAEGGAGFVHELDLRITAASPGRVEFELPITPRLVHGGGVVCGQSIMACMDTGMVFVMASLRDGGMEPFTTVDLHTVFERGLPGDLPVAGFVATASKAGRTLVFGEVDLLLPDGTRAAHATTTYMWLPADED